MVRLTPSRTHLIIFRGGDRILPENDTPDIFTLIRKANTLWMAVGNRGVRFVSMEADAAPLYPSQRIYDIVEESIITVAKMCDWMDTVNLS